MPTSTARATDEITDSIKAAIDRLVDARVTQEVARRGQEAAAVIAERGSEVGDLASEAWRDSRPLRRDAAKRLSRATEDATKWSDRTWRKRLRPMLKDLWKQRTLAAGAAGAAVPAGRELVDSAAVRLGLRQREEHHWGAFFLGLLLGAVGGAVVALLTTPKRGDEVRRELTTKADELATKAREEWVPLFQSGESNGHTPAGSVSGAGTSLEDAAAEAGAASGAVAEQAADDTAEQINESYDSVEREPTS
jgi:gas vesicle protein